MQRALGVALGIIGFGFMVVPVWLVDPIGASILSGSVIAGAGVFIFASGAGDL